MKYPSISKKIIALKNADLKMRENLIKTGAMGNEYHTDMEALHNYNADQLDLIITSIGYPTIDKVGKEANHAAWLVIQHSISKPAFMKKCAAIIETSMEQSDVNQKQLAYLKDRMAVYEGKEQLYGTQFDWDHNGELSPQPYKNIDEVNKHRSAIGLNSIEEQTIIFRQQAIQENQVAPVNPVERKHKYDLWRRKVGWIK